MLRDFWDSLFGRHVVFLSLRRIEILFLYILFSLMLKMTETNKIIYNTEQAAEISS